MIGQKTRLELTGQRFGRLTVKEFSHVNKNGQAFWLCKCNCGDEKIIRGNALRGGLTKSCGCLQKERFKEAQEKHKLPKGVAACNRVLYSHKRAAKLRNIEQDLTDEQIIALHKKNCYYCGAPSSNVYSMAKRNGSVNGIYVYNGIDRVDNTKGYTIDNVVPCCADCNYLKKGRPYDEFLNKIKRIHSYLNLEINTKS